MGFKIALARRGLLFHTENNDCLSKSRLHEIDSSRHIICVTRVDPTISDFTI